MAILGVLLVLVRRTAYIHRLELLILAQRFLHDLVLHVKMVGKPVVANFRPVFLPVLSLPRDVSVCDVPHGINLRAGTLVRLVLQDLKQPCFVLA